MSIVVCRLMTYEDLPSPREDEKWCRFHFSATPREAEPRDERPHPTYRVDVSSNRALKAKTLRLVLPDLERLLYCCAIKELAKSLGIDPSVRNLRVALRWGSLLDPDVARTRFPSPDAFEVALAAPPPAPSPAGWPALRQR